MATGFEDDLALGSEEHEAMELTEREVAIAAGDNPDSVGVEEEATEEAIEDATEEADDTEVVEEEDGAAEVEEGTEAPDTDSWVNDDIKALAETYGIGEDGLGTFGSASEFRKFASLMDKYSSGKPKEEAAQVEVPIADDDLDPKKFADEGYDDNTVKIVDTLVKSKATVSQLVERISKLEGMLEESSRQQETALLHRAIDDIGGRFGSGGNLSDEQRAAREKLLESAEIVKQSLEKRGDKVVNASVLLRRAELLAFGDEIIAEETAKAKEAFADKVKKQSAKRRPVGRNTKPPARQSLGEADNPVKAIANSPELVEFWKNIED